MAKIKTSKVHVELGKKSYEVVIGSGLLSKAGKLIKPIITSSERVFIITDENIAKLHLEKFKASLGEEGIETEEIILSAGEQTKSFEHLESLMDSLLKLKPERNSILIALGGGVVGDITGFAASILLRGVGFIQIPTTLLSMVDSSVGGKTGINTKYGKNLVGSFYQPRIVIADMDLLSTLSDRQWLAGYAEIVKYGLINDASLFKLLEKAGSLVAELRKTDDEEEKKICLEFCKLIISKSCEAKAKIVSKDEKEGGVRALLNFGHTFGHALEAETGYSDKLLHGEAVSIGMVIAFQFSAALGLCSAKDIERVANHLLDMNLPISPEQIGESFSVDNIIEHIYRDKKVRDGKIVFILSKGIGKAFIKDDVDKEDLYEFLRQLLSHRS